MYGSFDALTTEEMALEGRVYRRMDQVIRRMGKHAFLGDPIGADAVADLFSPGRFNSR